MADEHSNDNDGNTNNIPVRTLHVEPINVKEIDMNDHIKSYFERFGTVNSVEIVPEDNACAHFALVEFKLAETAALVLSSNEVHHIDGCDVEVRAAKPWQQPDHILNALNDDCLRAVFKKLNLNDLTNTANVCVRFSEEAKRVFSTKFKKLNLDTDQLTCERVKHLLRTFSSVAQSIEIGGEDMRFKCNRYKIQILTIIAECCTSVLKEVTFSNFHFDQTAKSDSSGIKSDSVLMNLERLTLYDCDLQYILNDFLSVCGELKGLHIQGCWLNLNHFIGPKLHRLEELRLNNIQDLNTVNVKSIIGLCSTLKKISIIPNRIENNINVSEVISFIVHKLPHLLELEFNVPFILDDSFAECFQCLGQLKLLKVLKLDFRFKKFALKVLTAALTENAVPIEHMELKQAYIDTDVIKGIAHMKHLKVLELSSNIGLTDEHLLELAKGLGSRLEKLQLMYSMQHITVIGLKKMLPFATKLSVLTLTSLAHAINEQDYQEMLCILQMRPEKIMLQLSDVISCVDVDERILVKNSDILYIN